MKLNNPRQPKSPEAAAEQPTSSRERTPLNLRAERIRQIDEQLEVLGQEGEATSEEAADIENHRLKLQNEQKINQFLIENLPDTEERIAAPMDPHCEVSIVIPVYGERDWIFRPLQTLAEQKGVKPKQYEAIFVINNPPAEPSRDPKETAVDYKRTLGQYHKAVEENQQVLDIINYINGANVEVELNGPEEKIIKEIKKRGIKIFAIDKASPGKTLPEEEANVGGARNRGIAEAVARFYEQKKENGIIAQTDADTKVNENYIKNLIKAFKENPVLVGLTGEMDFEKERGELFRIVSLYEGISHLYRELLTYLAAKETSQLEKKDAWKSDVYFSGANMSSRAYEAAIVGGIMKVKGGEDPDFGYRLAEIGKIDRAPDVKTMPAERESARTAVWAGHGQTIIRAREAYKAGGVPTAFNPENAKFQNEYRKLFIEAFQKSQTGPEDLKRILSINGEPLLTEEEYISLSGKLRGVKNLEKLKSKKDEPDFTAINKKIDARINELLPRIPLEEASEQLMKRLCADPQIRKKYEIIKKNTMAEENKWVEKRLKLLNGLLDAVYRDKPEKIDLVDIMRKNKKEIGADNAHIEGLEKNLSVLRMLTEVVEKAETESEAMALIKELFYDELIPAEQNPLRLKFLEMSAMRQTIRELHKKIIYK